MKPITFEASVEIDREAFDVFRKAARPRRLFVSGHWDGRCSHLGQLAGGDTFAVIVERANCEAGLCAHGSKRAPGPRCKRCEVLIDENAVERRAALGREIGLPLPAPTVCVDCALAGEDEEPVMVKL